MSTIARAFTTRRVKMSTDLAAASKDPLPQRSNTTKPGAANIRSKISAPLELIHTTNMLSYNAPDIRPAVRNQSPAPSSRTASTRSDDDSEHSGSSSPSTVASSPPTSPDVSPSQDKDERSLSPEPNHLSCYFMPPGQASPSPAIAQADAPVIPQRAPSHTKKASYEAMARSRSNSALNNSANSRMSNQSGRTVSTKASFSFSTGSRVSSTSTAASSISHTSIPYHSTPKPPVPTTIPSTFQQPQAQQPSIQRSQPMKQQSVAHPETHPFGHELAQVTEIAEEYGVKDRFKVIDEEEKELVAKGLHKFTADDYLSEIHSLINSFFITEIAPPTTRHARPVAAVWI